MTKILFVCSYNRERSITAEYVFKDIPGCIVKSAGTKPEAETKVTIELLEWADKIYAMQQEHFKEILRIAPGCIYKTKILGVEDKYTVGSAELIITLLGRMVSIEPLDKWLKTKFGVNSTLAMEEIV
jgi:predicted protein tyrosine phosphatase